MRRVDGPFPIWTALYPTQRFGGQGGHRPVGQVGDQHEQGAAPPAEQSRGPIVGCNSRVAKSTWSGSIRSRAVGVDATGLVRVGGLLSGGAVVVGDGRKFCG